MSDKYSFIDEGFGGIDTRADDKEFLQSLANSAEGEDLEKIEAAEAVFKAAAAPPAPSDEPDEFEEPEAPPVGASSYPKRVELADGSSYTIEKTATGLKAIVDIGAGAGKEHFYGSNESELLNEVLAGKVNASLKIRQQNQELKLKTSKKEKQTPTAPKTTVQKMDTNAKFELKTMWDTDPEKALDTYISKRFGLTPEEFAAKLQRGEEAADAQVIESESRAFIDQHPRYLNTTNNYHSLIAWLTVNKLNKDLPDLPANAGPDEATAVMEPYLDELMRIGQYNQYTLAEAYSALAQAGLLDVEEPVATPVQPATPPPAPPAPVVVQPKPAVPESGIPAARVRTRATPASFGLRQQVSTPTLPETDDGVPTDEDLEKMSTEDINKLLEQVAMEKARQYHASRR